MEKSIVISKMRCIMGNVEDGCEDVDVDVRMVMQMVM